MPRRRSVLASGLGLASALTGCGSLVPGGRPDHPETGPPRFRRWYPAESVTPWRSAAVRLPSSAGIVLDVGRLRELASVLPANAYRSFLNRALPARAPAVPIDRIGTLQFHQLPMIHLATGSFADVETDGQLDRADYEMRGTHRGFRVYECGLANADASVVAVREDAIVWYRATPEDDPRPVETVRAIVDARAGTVRRAHESRSHLADVSMTLGMPLYFQYLYQIGGEERTTMRTARSLAVDGETTYRRYVAAFDGDPDVDRVHSFLADDSVALSVSENAHFERREATVVVTDPIRTAALGSADRTAAEAEVSVRPMASLTCSYDAGTLTVEHLAGDPVSLRHLYASGIGRDRPLGTGRIRAGDALRRQAEPQVDRITVYDQRDDVAVSLATCRVPTEE